MEEMSLCVCVCVWTGMQGLGAMRRLESRKQVPRKFPKRPGLQRLGNRNTHQPAESGVDTVFTLPPYKMQT